MVLAPKNYGLFVEDYLVDPLGEERLARVSFDEICHLWLPTQRNILLAKEGKACTSGHLLECEDFTPATKPNVSLVKHQTGYTILDPEDILGRCDNPELLCRVICRRVEDIEFE